MEWMNVSFIILSLGLIGFSHCNNCDMSYTSRLVIKECLKLGKIAQIRTFQCYPANSQGGCDAGERLVVNKQSVCKATHCINNKDAEGTPCADGLIAYNGRCYQDGSKTACEGEGKGRRLYADLYGAVSCKCSEDLGYVEVNGTCYHEHFRGPCEIGQSLRGPTLSSTWYLREPRISSTWYLRGPTISSNWYQRRRTISSTWYLRGTTISSTWYLRGPTISSTWFLRGPTISSTWYLRRPTISSTLWKCVPNNCGKEQVMWEDGRCYEVKTPAEECEDKYDLMRKDGREETLIVGDKEHVEDLLEVACLSNMETFSAGTFSNCAARSRTTGLCLARRTLPAYA